MPVQTATKSLIQSEEDQQRQAKANMRRAQTRAAKSGVVGYIIRAPLYGKVSDKGERLWETIGKSFLHVHRHNIPNEKAPNGYEVYEGSTITMVDCEGFTTKKVEADYIKAYWGRDGYTVTEVLKNGTFGLLGQSGDYLKAKSIMDGTWSGEDDEDEDEAAVDAHPDTPRIVQESGFAELTPPKTDWDGGKRGAKLLSKDE